MDKNKPVQMPFGSGNVGIDYGVAHIYVSQIVDAIKYFERKSYHKNDLILQIPLPLRVVLAQISASQYDRTVGLTTFDEVNIFDVKTVAGYEARIVMYNPERSFYENNPMAVIDFEVKDGLCQRPVLSYVE
jgi:hypothetical protein